jgi:hypothetical protein
MNTEQAESLGQYIGMVFVIVLCGLIALVLR